MWPSTRATWLEAATSVDWVTFRELATTLKPRSTNPCTIPAPIPCDAPVTMAVFRGPFMVVCLETTGSGCKYSRGRQCGGSGFICTDWVCLRQMGHPINWLMVRRSLFRGSVTHRLPWRHSRGSLTSISHLPEDRTRPMFYGRIGG